MRTCFLGVLLLLAPWSGRAQGLRVVVSSDGRYSVGQQAASGFALTAGVAAQVDGRWLRESDYPKHAAKQTSVKGYLGEANEWEVTFSGLGGAPDIPGRWPPSGPVRRW